MNEFIKIEFRTSENQDNLCKLLISHFPYFEWRKGDSDMQGLYISGMNNESVQIQLWLEKNSEAMTISFRSLSGEKDEREKFKHKIYNNVKDNIFPSFTKIVKIKENA